MRHHEIGIVKGEVHRHGSRESAVDAADEEHAEEAEGEEHWRFERNLAAPERTEPVEHLNAGRDADEPGHKAEPRLEDRTGGEHVVRPNAEAQAADTHGGEDERLVAKQRLAREDGQNLGDDAHARQNHDVNGRVGVEPEDVLPEDGVAAAVRVEEVAAEVAVHKKHDKRGGEHWRGQELEDRGHEHRPAEDRHAEHGHPRGPHPEHGDEEVGRADGG